MAVLIDGNDFYTRTGFWAVKEPFTVCVWFYATVLPDAGTPYLGIGGHKWTGGNNGQILGLRYVSGNPRFFLGTNNFNFDGSSTLSATTWYHGAYTRSVNTHTGYLNGVQEATGSDNADTSGDLCIGDWDATDNGDEWQGRFAAVKLWDAALTVAEIQQEMRQYLPHRTTNLLGFFPLTTIGDDEIDFSGNGKTLTVTGSPVTIDGPPIPWKRGRSRRVYIPAAGGGATAWGPLMGLMNNRLVGANW